MPTATTTQPPAAAPRKRLGLVQCIVISLLILIVIVGLTVLIIWLIIRPKGLVYTIEDGSIHNFNLHYNHLNSTFDFVIRAKNPNHRVTVIYDSIEVSVAYDDQNIAFNTLEPFHQPTRNVTRLTTELVSSNVALSKSGSKHLRVEKRTGEIEVDIRVKARIRFKVGIWKSNHRTLRILCSPVMHINSSSKDFQTTACDVDI